MKFLLLPASHVAPAALATCPPPDTMLGVLGGMATLAVDGVRYWAWTGCCETGELYVSSPAGGACALIACGLRPSDVAKLYAAVTVAEGCGLRQTPDRPMSTPKRQPPTKYLHDIARLPFTQLRSGCPLWGAVPSFLGTSEWDAFFITWPVLYTYEETPPHKQETTPHSREPHTTHHTRLQRQHTSSPQTQVTHNMMHTSTQQHRAASAVTACVRKQRDRTRGQQEGRGQIAI
jgi:hypothetical protein